MKHILCVCVYVCVRETRVLSALRRNAFPVNPARKAFYDNKTECAVGDVHLGSITVVGRDVPLT